MKRRDRKWSRSKIIKEIKNLFSENKNITPKEIREKYSLLYQATQHGTHFNGWREAVRKAGLLSKYDELVKVQYKRVIQIRKRTRIWSRQIIQKEMKSLYQKGVPLDGGYIRRHYYNLLHTAEHRRYFGSWRKAVESIGINYNALMRKCKKRRNKKAFSFINGSTDNVVKKWLNYLKERNYSKATIDSVIRHLKMFDIYMNGMDIKNVCAADIRRFIAFCARKGYSINTVSNFRYTFKSFFGFCCDNKMISENPMKFVVFPKCAQRMPAVLSEEELKSFLRFLDNRIGINDFTKIRDKIIVELIAFCGLRHNEVRNLKLCHIDFWERTIKIEQGKGRKDRLIPLNDRILNGLNLYLKLRKPSRSRYLILINNKSNPLDRTYFNYILRRLSTLSGLKCKITPKILRNTFATLLFEKGASLKSIQELLGHSRIATTFQYIRVSINYLRNEIKKHPLLNM